MAELKNHFYTHLYGLLLASGGFVFGLGVGTFTTFYPYFINQFGDYELPQYKAIRSWLGFCFTAGALIACATGGFLLDFLGRYWSIVVVMGIEIAALLSQAYPNLKVIYGLRVVVGYCACFWTLSVPGMIFDVLPPSLAGVYSGLFGAFVTAGIGVGFFMGHSWAEKYWQAVMCWPAAWEAIRLILLLTLFRVRSPVDLAENNEPTSEIAKQYAFFYDPITAEQLASELESRIAEDRKKSSLEWGDILSRKYGRQIFIAVLLNVLNQMTGINMFAFYCGDLFETYGFSKSMATNLSVGFTGVGVFSSLVVSFMAAKLSIRPIIIWGLFIQAVGQLILITGIVIAPKATMLIVVGPYVYSYGYSQALGGLMYAYCGLIVPAKIMPFCVFFQWLLCCITVRFLSTIRDILKDLKMFFIFQIFTVIGTFLFIGHSVDLHGVSREKVLSHFDDKKFFS